MMNALPPQDLEGFLLHREDWTPTVARALAAEDDRTLTPDHEAVILLVQTFYDRYGIAPNNRALVRAVKSTLGPEQGSSMALMKLFGGTPAKTVAKYAGLAKPPHCL
jgi:tRNA 2-thiouridine synthesizing protein E